MKPMLSAKLDDPSQLRYPVLVSPKLDGIRCLIIGRVPVSRKLKHIPNRAIFETLRDLNLPELDGELVVGKPNADDVYRTTNSGVMSRDGEPDWTFWVFDLYTDGGFEERLRAAKAIVQKLGHKRIRMVPHVRVDTPEKLLEYEKNHLLAGYEGVMGRSLHGTYKQGRSTMREGFLWKLKRFEDSEAEIIGFDEQMHNANEQTRDELGRAKRSSHKAGMIGKDTLGALKVRDVNSGVEFDIGTGFSDAERDDFWQNSATYLGAVVKYKFLPVGVKEKPRHPVYLGLRGDL